MAQANTAWHGGTQPCGGEVVGYSGSANGIVNNWLLSPAHHGSLTWSNYTSITLAFVTRTNPDGTFRTFGVGQLC